MWSFIIAIALLVGGYFLYGKLIVKNFGPDKNRTTPAYEINDGVDYVPMPLWKVFLIQLLNIAGTGPIFGALAGAIFGPVVYIWIVFGCIFAGAVHDYNIGMLSLRHRGASVSEITGFYLGGKMKTVMRIFSVVLLVMCGVVFTKGPAGLLALITPEFLTENIWFWIILAYYFVATFVPIDKVIGKIYPVFGICLIIMALGVGGSMLFSGNFTMPEVWNNLSNVHPQDLPLWPFLLITVACGAISGFHSTQSPMMARCLQNEAQGQKVFYGAMIAEGIIALVWAAAGVTVYESSQALLDAGGGCSAVVYTICQSTMGKVGMVLAMLGVIACPISSGDTAFRSARLTIADWFKVDQKDWKKRLALTLPLIAAGAVIAQFDYSVVWRYFSWANQTLATIALWTITIYFTNIRGKKHRFTLIPALFMTAVTVTYFFAAPECLGALWQALGLTFDAYYPFAIIIGLGVAVVLYTLFSRYKSTILRFKELEANSAIHEKRIIELEERLRALAEKDNALLEKETGK